ncbi:MAG TPA: NAD-dependent deacylase [Phycisphaerales bacterium]|nr:NAD-dependent deacylase [Phycisphaerales bacterium]
MSESSISYQPLGTERYKKIVFLTGAGISKASGLPTYRGKGGVWTTENVEDIGTKEAMEKDSLKIWRAYVPRHRKVLEAKPNAAHQAIADLQKRLGEKAWVCVLTQNVDGLHQAAGTESVIEAHGSLRRLRCTECSIKPWEITEDLTDEPPPCPDCGAPARFDIVLFNEPVDPMLGLQALAFLGDCDLYITVGTSGLVAPASQLIDIADEAGARTVFVNTEPEDGRYQEYYVGKAEELLPHLLR